MVIWTQGALRKLAAEEALRVMEGPAAGTILARVMTALLHGEAPAKLSDAARQEAAQIAQELGRSFAHLIEEQKEEAKRLIAAQKSLATRQINEHVNGLCANAAAAMRNAEARADVELREVERRLRLRSEEFERQLRGRLESIIEDRLRKAILEAARQVVRQTPIVEHTLSNREIAAANGISLRAAKRLRRANSADASNALPRRFQRRTVPRS